MLLESRAAAAATVIPESRQQDKSYHVSSAVYPFLFIELEFQDHQKGYNPKIQKVLFGLCSSAAARWDEGMKKEMRKVRAKISRRRSVRGDGGLAGCLTGSLTDCLAGCDHSGTVQGFSSPETL